MVLVLRVKILIVLVLVLVLRAQVLTFGIGIGIGIAIPGSVITNLMTSPKFGPIRFATTPFHFGRTRKFILLSSTAESSATSGYVVIPESFGQNEERTGRNEERTRKKNPTLSPAVDSIDAT